MGILSLLFRPRAKHLPGVYSITNRRTGCIYIGATTKPMIERWARHRSMLIAKRHHNKRLQEDWQRYGEGAFKFAVLEVVEDDELVFKREREWQHKWYTPTGCYNPDPETTMQGSGGLPMTPQTPTHTRDELLGIYRDMRVQGISRDKARKILRERGISISNDLWAEAGRV